MLYETNSANGGDPAKSMRSGGKSSRRSAKKSEMDMKLQELQKQRRNEGQEEVDSGSSQEEGAAGDDVVLSVCRSHQRTFVDEQSIARHLKKKLRGVTTFSSLNCKDVALHYEAINYLATLVKQRGTSPMRTVDLTATLFDVNMEQEEISNSLNTLLDALETKGVLALILYKAILD